MGKEDDQKKEEAEKRNLTSLYEAMSKKADELEKLIRERKVRAATYYSGEDPETGMTLSEADSIICATCYGLSRSIEWMVANEIGEIEIKVLQELLSIPESVGLTSTMNEIRGGIDFFHMFRINFFNMTVRVQELMEDLRRDSPANVKQGFWRNE